MDALVSQLVALVAPPRCVACGSGVPATAGPLCPCCRAELPWLSEPRCPRCALPAHDPRRECPARIPSLDAVWAPLAYAGPARALVSALKFRGALGLADLMAAQLAAGAPPALLDGATLVPVPTAPRHSRTRGFDHAERITRALARRTGRPLAVCLRRGGPPSAQLGAPRAVRLAPGRLQIVVAAPVPPVSALVDDVHTTGATLDACATALRAAGTRRVVGLTWARTLP